MKTTTSQKGTTKTSSALGDYKHSSGTNTPQLSTALSGANIPDGRENRNNSNNKDTGAMEPPAPPNERHPTKHSFGPQDNTPTERTQDDGGPKPSPRYTRGHSPASMSSEFEDYEEDEEASSSAHVDPNWQLFQEMKETVMDTLETKGVLGKIRAELRAAIYTAIDEDERQQGIHRENPKLKLLENKTTGPLLVGLARDLLDSLGLNYTRSCFDSEISKSSASYSSPNRDEIQSQLDVSVEEEQPVLYGVVKRVWEHKYHRHGDSDQPKKISPRSKLEEEAEEKIKPTSPRQKHKDNRKTDEPSRTAQLGLKPHDIQSNLDDKRKGSSATSSTDKSVHRSRDSADVDNELQQLLSQHSTPSDTAEDVKPRQQKSNPPTAPSTSSNPPDLPSPSHNRKKLDALPTSSSSKIRSHENTSQVLTSGYMDSSSSFESSSSFSPTKVKTSSIEASQAGTHHTATSHFASSDVAGSATAEDANESTSEAEEDLALSVTDSRSLEKSDTQETSPQQDEYTDENEGGDRIEDSLIEDAEVIDTSAVDFSQYEVVENVQ